MISSQVLTRSDVPAAFQSPNDCSKSGLSADVLFMGLEIASSWQAPIQGFQQKLQETATPLLLRGMAKARTRCSLNMRGRSTMKLFSWAFAGDIV